MTDTAISPLRQRLIEDMTIRKLGTKTQSGYAALSRTSPRSSAIRPTGRPPTTSAAISCTSQPAASAFLP